MIGAIEAFRSGALVFWRCRAGGSAIEYGLIVSLIVIGIIVATNSIGASTSAMYTKLDKEWDAAASK